MPIAVTQQTFLSPMCSLFLLCCVLYSDQTSPKNRVPVLRAVANFFAHDVGRQVMHHHRRMVGVVTCAHRKVCASKEVVCIVLY